MLQLRRDFALALEARDHHVVCELGRQNFDDYRSVESRISSAKQPTHSTTTQLVFDLEAVGKAESQPLDEALRARREYGWRRRRGLGAHRRCKNKGGNPSSRQETSKVEGLIYDLGVEKKSPFTSNYSAKA